MSTLKGTAVKPNFDWVKQTYGEAVWTQILDRLPHEARAEVEFVQGARSYDLKVVSAVLETLVELQFPNNLGEADRAFRAMGAFIARDSLTGVYSLFIRIARPEAILKRIPTVISTMFDGVTGEMFVEDGPRRARVVMRGLEDLAYAGPRLCGWAEQALSMCGATATVTERNWQAGIIRSDELIYDASW